MHLWSTVLKWTGVSQNTPISWRTVLLSSHFSNTRTPIAMPASLFNNSILAFCCQLACTIFFLCLYSLCLFATHTTAIQVQPHTPLISPRVWPTLAKSHRASMVPCVQIKWPQFCSHALTYLEKTKTFCSTHTSQQPIQTKFIRAVRGAQVRHRRQCSKD